MNTYIHTPYLFACLIIFSLLSCSQDDGNPVISNEPPVIQEQTFSVPQDIDDVAVIGQVAATDEDSETLTFSIVANPNDLFELTASGELSLADGQSFSEAGSLELTVQVSDGENVAEAKVTVEVTKEDDGDNGDDGDDGDGGDDGDDATPPNEAPVIEDQEFYVLAEIDDQFEIGVLTATDVDSESLTFRLVTNSDDLFELTEEGSLSLATGEFLDFAKAKLHTVTVMVSDGVNEAQAAVTIRVGSEAFITTWTTTTENESITIATRSGSYQYNYIVNWGDGKVETNRTINAFHSYSEPGTYTVSITGEFPAIVLAGVGIENGKKLQSIENWGKIQWETMFSAFANGSNVVYNAEDVPDLSNVTSTNTMFFDAERFNGDLSGWDVSNVTDMGSMFASAESFNGNVSNWDVSQVTNFTSMFSNAAAFDRSLGNWDIREVTSFSNMLNNSGLSTANYDATLKAWAELPLPDINFGQVNGLTYCDAAARDKFRGKGIDLSGDALADDCGF